MDSFHDNNVGAGYRDGWRPHAGVQRTREPLVLEQSVEDHGFFGLACLDSGTLLSDGPGATSGSPADDVARSTQHCRAADQCGESAFQPGLAISLFWQHG